VSPTGLATRLRLFEIVFEGLAGLDAEQR
jgi:hypothetical protein